MKIASSSGGTKNITLIGVADVANMLFELTNDIETLGDEQLLRSATFVATEVQASIMGQRAEPKSVDTGNFANSLQVKGGEGEATIYSDVEYAKFLEFGTSKMSARSHFTNTALRVEDDLKEQFNVEVNKICDKANE